MRVVLQRVSSASVRVDGNVIGDIGPGLVLLIGIHRNDTDEDMHYVMDKCVHLRIFSDETGKMNHSVLDMGGELLGKFNMSLDHLLETGHAIATYYEP